MARFYVLTEYEVETQKYLTVCLFPDLFLRKLKIANDDKTCRNNIM